jgi:hypothetical protein
LSEGAVEVDEAYIGGKNKNRHQSKKKRYFELIDKVEKARGDLKNITIAHLP